MLLWKLLRHHFSIPQLAGFFMANFFGLAVVLVGLQFYNDVVPVMTAGDSFMKEEYIVVTKHVGMGHALKGTSPGFRESEIRDLGEQPFVESVGRFTPAAFDVSATIGTASLGMTLTTEMFFESIPDAFIDADLSEWRFDMPGDSLPVILPRNYLNLYNFGFAGSRGLPAISEGLVRMVSIRFRLRGTQGGAEVPGRVVAFSNRINTILVPQSFMERANATLSPDRPVVPSRLIVDVSNPADPRIATYLADRGYETEGGGGDSGRTAYFLRLTTGIVMGVGLIICTLAFYVLLLSIYLLLQKHTEKIDNLLLIGYTPAAIARPFHLLALGLNAGGLVLGIVAVVIVRSHYIPALQEVYPGLAPSALWPALACGAGIAGAMALLNFLAIRRKVMAVWRMHF